MNSGNVSKIILYVVAGLIVFTVASDSMDAYSYIMRSINQNTINVADVLLVN